MSTTSSTTTSWSSPRRPWKRWRRDSNECAFRLRRHPRAGDYREIQHGFRIEPGGVQGAPRRDQARDQGGRRAAVQGQGAVRQHHPAQGQDQDVSWRQRQAAGRQESDRQARRRRQDRRDHEDLARHGPKNLQTNHAEPAPARACRPQPSVEGQARQGADRRPHQVGRPQQSGPRVHVASRRRPQAQLPHGRFQARQARHAGDRGAARIRSEPHRVHCADPL